MSHDLAVWEKFLLTLAAVDAAHAAKVKAAGCGECGGRLDVGTYPRKPRGELGGAEKSFTFRESFCCRRCRLRTTPESLRFLGRKVYAAVLVVVACVAGSGAETMPAASAATVPRRTVRRWRGWWTVTLIATVFWTEARARFANPVEESLLPASLLGRFGGIESPAVERLLRFTSPITTATQRSRISMET